MGRQLPQQLRMVEPQVLALTRAEHKVARRVVAPVAVDVVDALSTRERATDNRLHHPAMLHDPFLASADVDDDPNVALGAQVPTRAGVLRARASVESRYSALIRAEVAGPRAPVSAPVKGRPASGAFEQVRSFTSSATHIATLLPQHSLKGLIS
jgi:hypothetical protein